MLKNVVVGLALASYAMVSIPASATEVRPAAVTVQVGPQANGAPVAALPRVAKKRQLAGLGLSPLLIGAFAVTAIVVGVASASSGDDSDESSPQ